MMDYHDLGIGGAAILLSFQGCSNSTSIELKLSQLLTDKKIHMWGAAPMQRNFAQVLQRQGEGSRMSLLKFKLNGVHGDHAQSLQLATIAQEFLKDDDAVKN